LHKGFRIIIAVSVIACAQTAFLFAAPLFYKDVESRMAAKEYDKAESIIGIYLSLNDKDVTALSMLGRLYQETGDKKKAAQALNKALKIDPDYPPAHFFLGKNYYREMKTADAVSEFAIFRAKMDRFPGLNKEDQLFCLDALDEIGEVYFDLKMAEEFYAVNQEILKMSPDDETATYNLGVYYYVYSHSNSRAYQLFNKVIEAYPDSYLAKKARYNIEFIRANPDSRMAADFDFIDKL
jgi:tetratricopeptide (TPR) repeat protein